MDPRISEMLTEICTLDPNAHNLSLFQDPAWSEQLAASPALLEQDILPQLRFLRTCTECTNAQATPPPADCPGARISVDIRGSEFYHQLKFAGKVCVKASTARAARQWERLLQEARIPPAYIGKTFASFSAYTESLENALSACKSYVEHYLACSERGIGLYIHGTSAGCGKTHLAIGTVREVVSRYSEPIRFVNLVSLFNEYKQVLFGSDSTESAYDLLPEVAQFCGLLLVDDIGSEVPTERLREFTYHLVNYRYMSLLPTIYTSNYTLKVLGSGRDGTVEGAKVSSRIEGRSHIVQVNAENYRGKEIQALLGP